MRRFSIPIAMLILCAGANAQPVYWDDITPQSPFLLGSGGAGSAIQTKIFQTELGRTFYKQIYQQSTARSDDQTQRAKISKSIAFVLSVGRDNAGASLTPQQRNGLRQTLETYLTEINPEVLSNNSVYQWRAIEMTQFSQAYDLYKGVYGPLPRAEALLAEFAAEAAYQLRLPLQLYNNLSAKLAGGLGTTALLLKDAGDPAIRAKTGGWLALSLELINTTFFERHSGTDGNGGYSEGPYYLRYAAMSLLPFFLAIENIAEGSDLNIGGSVYARPLHDPRFRRVFEWAAAIRMPDGRLPAFEDTYMYTRFPELAVLAGMWPNAPFLAWQNYDRLDPFSMSELASHMAETYDFRIEYLLSESGSHPAPAGNPLIRHMPEAGYSVFRSSWNADATYFAMIGKHGLARTGGSAFGSGHKHANEGGFILFSGGELLAMEPGYYQYNYRDSLIFGRNHNTILVDGKGADRTSLTHFIIGADAYIEDTLSSRWGGTSTVRTHYEDTDITRTAVFFKNTYVILRDIAESAGEHTFTHQVHGNGLPGEGTWTPDYANGSALWRAGGMKLHAHVGAVDAALSYETAIRKHAPRYREFAEHAAMYSSVRGKRAVFHTMLVPSPAAQDAVFTPLQTAPGVYAAACTLGNDHIYTASNTSGGTFSINTNLGEAATDASLSAVCADILTGVSLFLEDATSFSLSGLELIRSNGPATVIGHVGREEIELTVEADGPRTLVLFIANKPDTVVASGIGGYELQGNRLTIGVPGGRAEIRIRLSDIPTSAHNTPAAGKWYVAPAYPNPARGAITVPISMNAPGTVSVALYDMLGKRVHAFEREAARAGAAAITFTPPANLEGVYSLRVSAGGAITSQTVVLR